MILPGARRTRGGRGGLGGDRCGGRAVPPSGLFVMLQTARARLRFERGEYARCLEDVEALSDGGDLLGMGPGPALILAVEQTHSLIAVGRVDDARERADALEGYASRWGAPATMSTLYRAIAPVAGGAAEIVSCWRGGREVTANRRGDSSTPMCSVSLGAALRRQNHRAAARDPLREGLKVARRCGAVRLARQAQREARRPARRSAATPADRGRVHSPRASGGWRSWRPRG